ncbi:BgtA-20535 [Blumeria graminis f. sp. tritici]|uniref:BgtA-20535 n=2 Tax=Blumeria graminis f. sp. tritici TaxID=62690 RepID=A0A9X9MGH9_BLUGR|nr:hypothetical protein BGT96224_A20535 [Blumeria graminis f. sp. tritici 96224]VDB86294.1 BgtA-20535 [Blumeria graminis f. sp. tritici]
MSIPDSTALHNQKILGAWENGTDYTILSQTSGDTHPIQVHKVSQLPEHLESHLLTLPHYVKGDVYVIISILSGKLIACMYYSRIVAPLLDAMGVKHKALYTSTRHSIKEFATWISGTVILLSGDGGVNDLVNSLRCRVTLILFPLGTGNALFNSHIQDGIQTLLRGTPRPLPNFRVSFQEAFIDNQAVKSILGVVVASYGFHPVLLHEFEKSRRLDTRQFDKLAQELLKTPMQFVGKVNGENMKGYAAVTMVKKLDDRFCVSVDNSFRLIHLDTSDLMKGYVEGLGAWKVDKVELEGVCGKMCIDGLLLDVQGRVVIEEVESVIDLVT